jgi:hypothetical protein
MIDEYVKLGNNIMDAFKPPEYAIAARFYIDDWTTEEVRKLLVDKCQLSMMYWNRILNALQDIQGKPDMLDSLNLWHSEQLYSPSIKRN